MLDEQHPRALSMAGSKLDNTRSAISAGNTSAAARRRRSSREIRVDMSDILPAFEERNTGSNHDDSRSSLSLAGFQATERRGAGVVEGKEESGTRRSGRRSRSSNRGNPSVGSIGDVDKTLNDSNWRQLSRTAKSTIHVEETRTFSGKIKSSGRGDEDVSITSDRSADTLHTSNSSRVSTKVPILRGRSYSLSVHLSNEPSASSDSLKQDSSSDNRRTRLEQESVRSNPLCKAPYAKPSLEKQLSSLKVELANVKAASEKLQLEKNEVSQENHGLLTELRAIKTSEAKLKRMVATLQDEAASLKAKLNWSVVNEEANTRKAAGSQPLPSRVSGLDAVAKAVESLLGSETEAGDDKKSATHVPHLKALRQPLNQKEEEEQQQQQQQQQQRQQQPSLVRRLHRCLSNASFDTSSLHSFNLEDELDSVNTGQGPCSFRARRRSSVTSVSVTSDDSAVEHEETPRTRRARRRSRNFSGDDAAEVQRELNNLADQNEGLRRKNEAVEAERDRLRETLSQIMTVEAQAFPIGKGGDHEFFGADYEEELKGGDNQPPSSIRDFMTKVTSIRNIADSSDNFGVAGPTGRSISKTQGVRTPIMRTQSVESLLWDSFNEDALRRSICRENDFSSPQ